MALGEESGVKLTLLSPAKRYARAAERRVYVREYWGKQTQEEIADHLGISVWTVQRMGRRMDLPRPKRAIKEKPTTPRAKPLPLQSRYEPVKIERLPALINRAIPDFRPRECRWIEGEPDGVNTVYCNKPTQPDSSWCCEHHARVYIKVPDKPQAMDVAA